MLLLTFPQLSQLAAGAALVASTLGSSLAAAQALVGPAYTGPRFPGGHDSLRAVLSRELGAANPAWTEPVFVRLELNDAGTPTKGNFLVPPSGTPAATLVRNRDVRALVQQLVQRQPRWQPATGAPPTKPTMAQPTLLLPFGLPAAVPLAYSDELPTFLIPGGQLGNTLTSVGTYMQRAVLYPADAQRAQL